MLKACGCYFSSNFYFSPNDSSSKTMENVFLFHLKSSFFLEIFKFLYFHLSLSFFPVSHWFRGWTKKNLKIYDVINRLNKNLITHFVWYFEKEVRWDIKTLAIDRELYKEYFLWKNHAENLHQKVAPDLILILLNNPKQPLQARNSFKNKVFWKRIIKKP